MTEIVALEMTVDIARQISLDLALGERYVRDRDFVCADTMVMLSKALAELAEGDG